MLKKHSDIVGLVLAGGKATRMGYAKERINYHGKENLYYLADLLSEYFKDVYISIPKDYKFQLDNNYNYIVDQNREIGPIEGIYQGLKKNAEKAVFVLAVDLAAITKNEIETIIKSRDKSKLSTLFTNPRGQFEPLCAIWENSALDLIEKQIAEQHYGMQKLLKTNPVKIASISDFKRLININRPEEREDFEKSR